MVTGFVESVRAAVESSMPAVGYDTAPHENALAKIKQLIGKRTLWPKLNS